MKARLTSIHAPGRVHSFFAMAFCGPTGANAGVDHRGGGSARHRARLLPPDCDLGDLLSIGGTARRGLSRPRESVREGARPAQVLRKQIPHIILRKDADPRCCRREARVDRKRVAARLGSRHEAVEFWILPPYRRHRPAARSRVARARRRAPTGRRARAASPACFRAPPHCPQEA